MYEIKRIFSKNIIVLCIVAIILNIIVYTGMQLNGMTLGDFRKREILSEETDDIQIKKQTAYIKGYNKYIADVIDNSEEMKNRKIFSSKTRYSYNNIIVTQREYEKMRGITLAQENNKSLESYLEYENTSIVVMLLLIIIIFNMFRERNNSMWIQVYSSKNGRTRLMLRRIGTIFVGTFILNFVANISVFVTSVILYGKNANMNSYIQNLMMFKDFTYPISKFQYVTLLYICQIFVCFTLSLLVFSLFAYTRKRVTASLIIGLICSVEWLIYNTSSKGTVINQLKAYNILNIIACNSILSRHNTLSIFGIVEKDIYIIGIITACLLLVAILLVVMSGQIMRPVKKCTHANYIIENVSKFRQKIMNKETRFLLEIHKTFFTGKGYIVCLVIFISVFFVIQISGKQYSSLEKEHDRLYEEYGGKEYGQIISIVQEKEKNVEQALMYLNEVKDQEDKNTKNYEMELSYAMENYEFQKQILQSYDEFVNKKIYLENIETYGKKGYMLSDRGYEYMFSSKSLFERLTIAVILVTGIVMIVNAGQYVDEKSAMNKLINSSYMGRKKHNKMRIGAWYVIGITTICVAFIIHYCCFKSKYGTPYLEAPLCSLTYMGWCTDKISIGQGIIISYILYGTCILLISTVVCGVVRYRLMLRAK